MYYDVTCLVVLVEVGMGVWWLVAVGCVERWLIWVGLGLWLKSYPHELILRTRTYKEYIRNFGRTHYIYMMLTGRKYTHM